MIEAPRGVLLAAAALAALLLSTWGCRTVRWSGHHRTPDTAPHGLPGSLEEGPDPSEGDYEINVGTAPRRRRAALPHSLPESGTLFYSDLGPAEIDVSGYPTQQQVDYALTRRLCSQCHTLARVVNAPVVSRRFWQFYMLGMRSRSRYLAVEEISKEDARRIADFLEYDSRVRKIERKEEFERLSEELQERFEPVVRRRLEEMKEKPRKGWVTPYER